MSDMAIETRGLKVKIDGKTVLDGIDVSFRKGESVVIAGSNGAGKTTFLKCLAGVILPDRGRVLAGAGIKKDKIGFISDRLSLYERWTIGEAWRFHRAVFRIAEPALAIVPEFELDPDRRIKDLSVGERTLFHLALIQAQKPDILLLDEIVYAVDPYLREKFLETVIEGMDAYGTTVIMINHTFSDTAQIPDRALIMDGGRFIVDEKSENLVRSMKKIVSETPLPDAVPCLFKTETEFRKEYFVYPFRDEYRRLIRGAVRDIGLGEIVKAFIGGAYVQKRAR
jgi:ABC-type multidrug transport system ATPase subunit